MASPQRARTTCPACSRWVTVSRATEQISPHGVPSRCGASGQRIDLYGPDQQRPAQPPAERKHAAPSAPRRATPARPEPGTRGRCPRCGRRFLVNQAWKLRRHGPPERPCRGSGQRLPSAPVGGAR